MGNRTRRPALEKYLWKHQAQWHELFTTGWCGQVLAGASLELCCNQVSYKMYDPKRRAGSCGGSSTQHQRRSEPQPYLSKTYNPHRAKCTHTAHPLYIRNRTIEPLQHDTKPDIPAPARIAASVSAPGVLIASYAFFCLWFCACV